MVCRVGYLGVGSEGAVIEVRICSWSCIYVDSVKGNRLAPRSTASLHSLYLTPSLSYDTGQFHTFAPISIRSCCPSTSRRSSFNTFSAKYLQRYCMKGMCWSTGAKSSDILYSNLVLSLDEGKQTWSWWRCVAHCLVLCPSNFPGFEIPMVDSTIQGGRNSISMG